jgi:hypothetical protein
LAVDNETWAATAAAASGVLSLAALLVSLRALRNQRRAADAAGLSAVEAARSSASAERSAVAAERSADASQRSTALAEAAEEAEAARYDVPWELFRGAGDSYMLRNAGDERADAVHIEGVELDVIPLDDGPVEVAPRAAVKFIASPSFDNAHPRIRVTWRRPGHDRSLDWTEPLP